MKARILSFTLFIVSSSLLIAQAGGTPPPPAAQLPRQSSDTPLNPQARQFVSTNARIEHKELLSTALGYAEKYAVELPVSYASEPNRRYPVLYFLHGQFGNENDWERNGVAPIFERLEAERMIGETIVVMPNGRSSFFINAIDGKQNYEDFIVKELVAEVDKHYRTIPRREARGILGVSMGGYGALTLAMKHLDVFSVVGAHSAALMEEIPDASTADRRMQFRLQLAGRIFGSPIDKNFWAANNPILLAASFKNPPPLKIYFDCGDVDRFGFNVGAEVLHQKLNERGIPHEFHLFPGNHGWDYTRTVIDRSLKFVSQAFAEGLKQIEAKEKPAGKEIQKRKKGKPSTR